MAKRQLKLMYGIDEKDILKIPLGNGTSAYEEMEVRELLKMVDWLNQTNLLLKGVEKLPSADRDTVMVYLIGVGQRLLRDRLESNEIGKALTKWN